MDMVMWGLLWDPSFLCCFCSRGGLGILLASVPRLQIGLTGHAGEYPQETAHTGGPTTLAKMFQRDPNPRTENKLLITLLVRKACTSEKEASGPTGAPGLQPQSTSACNLWCAGKRRELGSM